MLTSYQQSSARYDGGKALANRKRHLAQVKSALISLCAEIEAGTNPAGLTATEVAALRTAARLVAGIETAYAKDASEAKRIQTEHEGRVKLATRTVHTLTGAIKAARRIAALQARAAAIPHQTPETH